MNLITNVVKSTCESEFCGEETKIVTERVITCSPIKGQCVSTEETVRSSYGVLLLEF